MKLCKDIKTLDITCGNYKKSGFCYGAGDTLGDDIIIAFNAGKVLSNSHIIKRHSLFQRLCSLRFIIDSKDESNETYSPLCTQIDRDEEEAKYNEKCELSYKELIDKRVDLRLQSDNIDRQSINKNKIKEIRKEEEKKQAQEEREQMIAEYIDILDVKVLNHSQSSIVAEITYKGDDTMDYDWFKRSARWFFQRQSLSNYEI